MKRFTLLLTLILFCSSITFAADDGKQRFQARTYINGKTCGQIISDLDKKENQKQFALLVGSFISGVNYVKNRNSKIPLKNMLIVTEMFCRQNPKKPLMAALINLDRVIDKQIDLDKKNKQQP